jgi:hypothetical protein
VHPGDAGNRALLGPGGELCDLSAIKNSRMDERAKFQFRGHFFNAFNRTGFTSIQVDKSIVSSIQAKVSLTTSYISKMD